MLMLCCGFLSAQTRPAANEPTSVTSVSIIPIAGAGYAGSDRCKSCHKPEFTEFGKTGHASLTQQKDSVAGCEMCHGAGKAHADAQEASHGDDAKSAAANKLIFSFNGNPKANSQRCLRCHQTSQQQSQFDHSSHALNGVACQDCHAIHLVEASDSPKGQTAQSAQAKFFSVPSLPQENRWLTSSLLRKNQPELCYQCHGNVRAAFALPTHHRVPEGIHRTGHRTCTRCNWRLRKPAQDAIRRSAVLLSLSMRLREWKAVRRAIRRMAVPIKCCWRGAKSECSACNVMWAPRARSR